jgi:TonB-dependent receptor
MPGYSSRTIDNIHITANVISETVVTLSEKLAVNLPPMEELRVVGTYVPDLGGVEAVITDQREAFGVSEVLGIDQMLRAGDSTAAAALKRVTGLTIEEDKFIVIRGQPERYTLTLWNGSPLPSPDPIRRIVPLDLFPTGSLSKIDVEKSYDASLPGSFGGGLIGLETIGVPDLNSTSFSVSLGGNTKTTGKTGLDYNGGDSDKLGYDDGTRDMPAGLADAESPAEVRDAARNFDNIWNISEKDIGPDTGLGFNLNRAFSGMGAELGLRISLNWDREYRTTERIERDYGLRDDGTLAVRNDQLEQRTDMNIDTSGLLAFTANWENHSLRSNTLLLRNSTKRSSISEGVRVVSDDLYIRDYLLEWNERELFAQQFIGEHVFGRFRVDWRAMLADSSRDSPDRRNYIYVRQSNGEYVFHDPSRAQRRFDKNDDDIDSFDIDLTVPFTSGNWKIDLVGGVSQYSQDRESDIRRYSFRTISGADLTAEPETLLNPANLGDTLQVTDQTQTNDNYLGEATIDAGYLKADIDWADRVRIIVGARQENADFQVRTFQAGGSQGGQLVEAGFDETEVLPSLSITWRFRDDMQLRFSSGRSLSHPLLNELSPARYYDPESNEEFLGNPDLQPAIIDSLDARWEWYPSERELISAGVFGKDYTDAIEQSFVGVGGSAYLRQIKNAPDATVSGTEFTARIELNRALPESWAGGWSELVYVQANATFIDSKVRLTGLGLETSIERPLQGQADEVYNLQLGYDGERHDIDLSYNRVGERLQIAGTEGQPDVYQQPIDQLDVNYSLQLLEGLKLKLNAANLLDAKTELVQGNQVYRSYQEGKDYSLTLSWSIE